MFANEFLSFIAKLPRAEKTLSEEQDLRCIFRRKTVKIALISFISLLVICSIIALIIIFVKTDAKRELIPSEDHSAVVDLGPHTVFTRVDWGGFPPKSARNITAPVRLVIIKHVGAGEICKYFESCSKRLQTIQSDNMAKGMPDIYCNFFIGGDGNIYIGRGWDVQPAAKDDTIDIVFSGNFDVYEPSEEMIDAAFALLRDGEERKKLAPDYVIVPHNQTSSTQSPGLNLIKRIKKWPHYSSGLFFHNTLVS